MCAFIGDCGTMGMMQCLLVALTVVGFKNGVERIKTDPYTIMSNIVALTYRLRYWRDSQPSAFIVVVTLLSCHSLP